jgi:proline-specific peptidase
MASRLQDAATCFSSQYRSPHNDWSIVMSATIPTREGFVPFRSYKTWYYVVGEQQSPEKLPLICLHGGPGALHHYLKPLERLAETGREVIFYDQIGCGRSDQPSDPSMWTVDLFVDELMTLRRELELERFHLLGQSWGGMLALEYALTQPEGLASLILASTTASIPHWIAESNRLRAELPPDVQETLTKHEEAGTLDDPAYEEATMVFYRRHVCRMDPWPDYVLESFNNMRQEVYNTMWGPTEFLATGNLRDWDVTDRLGEIRVPTLITCGEYDEATPALAEEMQRGILGSRLYVVPDGSHMAHAEGGNAYLDTVAAFMEEVERS